MIKIIKHLTRLNNSVNGNPRYRVTFDDGSEYVTASDRSFAYAITNPEYRDTPLRVTLTRAGRISDLTPLPPQSVTITRELLTQTIEALERAGCQFWACDGPTLEPVDMKTCTNCHALAQLRQLAS